MTASWSLALPVVPFLAGRAGRRVETKTAEAKGHRSVLIQIEVHAAVEYRITRNRRAVNSITAHGQTVRPWNVEPKGRQSYYMDKS
jgi:hypothetical protein